MSRQTIMITVSLQHYTLAGEVEKYIRERCHNDQLSGVRLDELARHFAASQRLLTEVFRKRYGVSVHHYILRERHRHICGLLADTALSIKEIAHRVGYYELGNFSRDFSRIGGMSPMAWRQQRNAKHTSQRQRG